MENVNENKCDSTVNGKIRSKELLDLIITVIDAKKVLNQILAKIIRNNLKDLENNNDVEKADLAFVLQVAFAIFERNSLLMKMKEEKAKKL
jgi:hypothetical protein